MSEFMGPPSSWYDPPDLHELCKCEDCHEADCHDELEEWAKEGCDTCLEKLAEAVLKNEYCLIHHSWHCEERTGGFCHEHGVINGGEDCTLHYLEA